MKTSDVVGHTAGPWGRNGSLITAQGDMRLTVASLPCGEDRICRFPDAAAKTFAARDANARLIAAAPELLDALHVSLSWLEALTPTLKGARSLVEHAHRLETVRAAIAKATHP